MKVNLQTVPFVIICLLVAAVGMVLLSRLGIDSSYAAHVLPALVITGLGFGAVVPPALSTATQGVEFRDAGVASGLANTMQQVGGSIGTSLLTAIAAQAAARSLGSRPAPSVTAPPLAPWPPPRHRRSSVCPAGQSRPGARRRGGRAPGSPARR